MPGALKDVVLRKLIAPGRYADGRTGLQLYVRAPSSPGGEPLRSWVLRYRFGGKRRDMGLGEYPAVSLAKARELTDAARELIRAGRDPLESRRATRRASADARTQTFKAAAEALMADKAKGLRNEKHRAQWRATLETYAYPVLGKIPVASITTDHVMAVLKGTTLPAGEVPAPGVPLPLWERAPETASRLRGRIEAVLDAAAASGWRDGPNPARWKGHLAARLPKPRSVKPQRHHPALAYGEVGDFIAALAARPGTASRALAFTILTAARTGEVRGMRWGEVDFAARVWTVPGERMKAKRAHRVPLSPQALAVLASVKPPQTKTGALVFPGTRASAPLSDMTLSAIVRRMNEEAAETAPADAPPRWRDAEGRAIVPHGFRSTFRDWCGETRADPREVVERCLAHSIRDKVEAAYARADLLERRRPLMEAWGEFCVMPAAGKVVSMQGAVRTRAR